jgi:ribosomal protein L29
MKLDKIRQLDQKKLPGELKTAILNYQKLMAEKAMMKLKDTSKLGKTKRYIARLKTVAKEKQVLAELDNKVAEQNQ